MVRDEHSQWHEQPYQNRSGNGMCAPVVDSLRVRTVKRGVSVHGPWGILLVIRGE